MRRWLVVRSIRWANRGWEASYNAYMQSGRGSRSERFWTSSANHIDRVARSLAHRLDPDNRWTGAEMAEHGWWG